MISRLDTTDSSKLVDQKTSVKVKFQDVACLAEENGKNIHSDLVPWLKFRETLGNACM